MIIVKLKLLRELNTPQFMMSHKYFDFESVQSARRMRVLVTIQSKENGLLLGCIQSTEAL